MVCRSRGECASRSCRHGVATTVYDVGGAANRSLRCARCKSKWEGGAPQGAAATYPFLPPFRPELWQRVVPVLVQACTGGRRQVGQDGMLGCCGVAVLDPAALIRRSRCDASFAAHAGISIAHVSSATLRFDVDLTYRSGVRTNDQRHVPRLAESRGRLHRSDAIVLGTVRVAVGLFAIGRGAHWSPLKHPLRACVRMPTFGLGVLGLETLHERASADTEGALLVLRCSKYTTYNHILTFRFVYNTHTAPAVLAAMSCHCLCPGHLEPHLDPGEPPQRGRWSCGRRCPLNQGHQHQRQHQHQHQHSQECPCRRRCHV